MKHAIAVAVLLVYQSSAFAAPTVSYSDGTFSVADWSFRVDAVGGGGTASVQQSSDGNPGTARKIDEQVNSAPSPGTYSAVWTFSLKTSAQYSPASQGAVEQVSYTLDKITTVSPSSAGDGMGTTLVVEQDGNIYVVASNVANGGWLTTASAALFADDFVLWTGSANQPFDIMQHPDFTGGGSTLTWGFATHNSTAFGGQGFSISGRVDNWTVQIEAAVPEAPTGALVLAGLAGLAFARRRRGRADDERRLI